MEKRRVKKLTVIEGDPGNFAVRLETPTGHQARGRLNFDQVVAFLERYFVFKDDSDFTKFDQVWKEIETQIANGETSGTVYTED